MKLTQDSVIQLHELYHRREEDKYLLGKPESGEFLVITAAELEAYKLLNKHLTLQHVEDMLKAQRIDIDLRHFLHELHERGFIHRINNRVITPNHEPLHELNANVHYFGGASARFLCILLSIFGLFTLVFFGAIPDFTVFFTYDYLSVTLVLVIAVAWVFIAVRQFIKHAAAQHLGVHTRFGLTNMYHACTPRTYTGRVTEEQQRYIVGMGLLALCAAISVALLLSVYTGNKQFWMIVYAIGLIELFAECLLFMDTDLAKLVGSTLNIHKLNKQTSRALKTDFALLWKGSGRPSHPTITDYAPFYMASMIIGFILFAVYLLPAMLYFLLLAFSRFTPGDPLFADALIALLFFSLDLILFGFAMLKHHPLAHNKFFINISVLSVVVGTYVLATVGLQWFSLGQDVLLTIVLSFALGVVIAATFEQAIQFAYPFTANHNGLELLLLPVFAAAIPISTLFTVVAGNALYLFALALGLGMLTEVSLHRMQALYKKK